MSIARHHAEWLSLVETSGPFLSMPVLLRVFPQGLDQRDPDKALRLREAYEDWLERGATQPAVHHAWIRHVLTELLEYRSEFLAEGQAIPPGTEAVMANYGETLRPEFVLKHREAGHKPVLLIEHYSPDQDLEKPVAGKTWKASPGTRMMELLHATDVPLGLVTNGEEWMIVSAPRGETTGFASWYADLWMQEPITLRAFHSLLHLRRFIGVAETETLSALYAESSKDQQEVTDQLGYQVRRAVEMLVQAFDRIDAESERKLLADVTEKDLYNSALTVMMRLVFLFSADERGLLLLGDPLYDQHYAVSTLSEILRERADQHGEEVLERRHDAWSRLLATFRAVHGGVEHEAMRLPPYGGTLFDPDRFPFLEGRVAGTQWRNTPAKPLPINNRVVLHLLEALQLLRVKVPGGGPREARRISFRALDIEQIGHVYEGLLDHTAKRANEVILGLAGSKNSEPEIALSKLEEFAARGTDAFVEFLSEETDRSEKALRKDLERFELVDEHALLIGCDHDPLLAKRIRPFAALLREDDFGRLVVIQANSVYVTAGSDRRSTGTHYTPRSLTEPIVQHTLEPLVYIGPAEGKLQAEWELKPPREILALKVCDMAMGSGAFLVQTCRFLAERLVEGWENAEKSNPGKILATPEGDFATGDPKERLIPADPAERLAVARRYVADRCLYGVDINPMAVEMAKLSLWLITLQRDRPFTFLDHALKCGDSLLGVSSIQQIEKFSLCPGERQVTFATANLFRYVEEAGKKRKELEDLPSNYHTQIEAKNRLHAEAEAATAKLKALADCLIALDLMGLDGDEYDAHRDTASANAQRAMTRSAAEFKQYANAQLHGRSSFHWPVEFPEVFIRGGFDAFVGNPPFMGGSKITGLLGTDFRNLIIKTIGREKRGNADLCTYFFLRVHDLLNSRKHAGLVATNTIAQGDTRDVGLDQLLRLGVVIYRATSSAKWPGAANLEVAHVWMVKGNWLGKLILDERVVRGITSLLIETEVVTGMPFKLALNRGIAFTGNKVYGEGFVLTPKEAEELTRRNSKNFDVVFPYARAEDINENPNQTFDAWVINFKNRAYDEAKKYSEVFDIVVNRVKPYRDTVKEEKTRKNWWIHERQRPELYLAAAKLKRVLFHGFTSKYLCFSFLPTDIVFAAPHVVLALDGDEDFALLQSSFHEAWVRKYASTLETRMRYPVSDVFETFPFPESTSNLAEIGKAVYCERSKLMKSFALGLTEFYNRFHQKDETAEDIVRLRSLHAELDQAVAVAYGWDNLDLDYGFHATKQGERYTISEFARRAVLDRLLLLNHQRYAEEVKAGLHEKGAKKSKTPRTIKSVPLAPQPLELALHFGEPPVSKPKLDAAATALVLIPYLLSEAARENSSLRMSELKLAFDFITKPELMKDAANPVDRVAADAWSHKWQSPAGPEWFIKTLRILAGATVKATTDEDDPPMALAVAPTEPDSPELREGVRLAVRIARAGAMSPKEKVEMIRERRSIFTAA